MTRFAHFQHALGQHESSNNYDYLNAANGALGYYSILPGRWAAWCAEYAGTPLDAPLPWQGSEAGHINQQLVATRQFTRRFDQIRIAFPDETATLNYQRLAASWKAPADMLADPATWSAGVKSYVAAIGAILNRLWPGEGW